MADACWVESYCRIHGGDDGTISILGFCGRDVADGLEQAAVVEQIDPVEGRLFQGFEGSPWSSPMDDLEFAKAVDRLGQGAVAISAETCAGDAANALAARVSLAAAESDLCSHLALFGLSDKATRGELRCFVDCSNSERSNVTEPQIAALHAKLALSADEPTSAVVA